jgi:hypothetical protein
MSSGISVYLSRSTRAAHLTAVLSLIALPIGLFLYGWYFQDADATVLLTAFGIIAGGGTLLFVRKARILRFDSGPAFIIRADGIEVSPDKVLFWWMLRDAVVFSFQGDKAIGLRLRKDLDQSKRSEIEAKFARGLDWQMFRMPLTIGFTGLSISGEEILTLLQKHGLTVTKLEKGNSPWARVRTNVANALES